MTENSVALTTRPAAPGCPAVEVRQAKVPGPLSGSAIDGSAAGVTRGTGITVTIVESAAAEPAAAEVPVVMPCLNEEASVGICVARAFAGIADAGLTGEVIVVDNGSADASIPVALSAGARVLTESRRGYGNACLTGFAAARGHYLVMGDSDDSHDFRELATLVAPLRPVEPTTSSVPVSQGRPCRVPCPGHTATWVIRCSPGCSTGSSVSPRPMPTPGCARSPVPRTSVCGPDAKAWNSPRSWSSRPPGPTSGSRRCRSSTIAGSARPNSIHCGTAGGTFASCCSSRPATVRHPGPLLAGCVLVGVLASMAASGHGLVRIRHDCLLAVGTGLVLLVVPCATAVFCRYMLPALVCLPLAGAFGVRSCGSSMRRPARSAGPADSAGPAWPAD